MRKFAKAVAVTAVVVASVATIANVQPAQAGNAGAAAVGGFVAGAFVGSVLSQPRYTAPAPVYIAPAPRYRHRPEPWTRAWYRYCSAKYRSFNPNTGYFVAYSGNHRFCR
ncbi:BA14K family protein [Roseibium limicola]|uniref:BA14K family protein n=1 Tax=Roseibium limicola TaxID=2816037 RepID=UPI002F3F1976